MEIKQLSHEEIAKLKPHEKTSLFNFLFNLILTIVKGKIEKPILVERKYKIILDGHHRVMISKLLKLPLTAILVDYKHVKLMPRRNIKLSKREVIKRALKGKLFPPKTTKHLTKHVKILT